jgi:Protein of unknown function (DUF1579)
MKLPKIVLLGIAVLLGSPVIGQMSPESHDDVLEHLAGKWRMDGHVMAHEAHHLLEAEWVLNHQFLRLHEKTAPDAPPSEQRYEAIWFLGYDNVSERYVLHLMDVFGARFSETLGYGTREGNRIRFIFEYPDGPFHTTLEWNPQKDAWEWLMEQKDKRGQWSEFGDLTLVRATAQ